MRRFAAIAGYALACLYVSQGYSQTLAIPGTPTIIQGGDDVRARDGTSCRQGTYQGATLDFGVTSFQNQAQNNVSSVIQNGNTANVVATPGGNDNQVYGVYARVIVPLSGGPRDRVDCTRLYSLEIERLQMELDRLKQSGSAAIEVK